MVALGRLPHVVENECGVVGRAEQSPYNPRPHSGGSRVQAIQVAFSTGSKAIQGQVLRPDHRQPDRV